MIYDGFLGYVDDNSELPKTTKDYIDRFLHLPKEEQNIYFDMVAKGLSIYTKTTEYGGEETYSLDEWIKTAIEYINTISADGATGYAIGKSIDNINSYKAPIRDDDNEQPIVVAEKPITWDEFFMEVAKLAAKRSKDPSTKVGAVIVKDNHIVSTGYNGMPYTQELNNDKEYPWDRGTNKEDSKYSYVVHAELNAILSSPVSVKGATMYVTLNSCNECAKAIVQSGITKVIYLNSRDEDIFNIGKKILSNAGVIVLKYDNIK